MKNNLADHINIALLRVARAHQISIESIPPQVKLERTKNPAHGDFASNIALIFAKKFELTPRTLAEKIIAEMCDSNHIAEINIAGAGFINITLTQNSHHDVISTILNQKKQYGQSRIGQGQRIHIEYVSANPTGPLHVGHGRGAAYGSSVVNILRATGFDVHSEYYVNDAGRQMHILATSIWLRYLEQTGMKITFPSNGYKGDYITTLANTLKAECGTTLTCTHDALFHDIPLDEPDGGDKEIYIDALIAKAKFILQKNYDTVFILGLNHILQDIKDDLTEFGVTFDHWFSEQTLIDERLIEHCIDTLKKLNHLYEKDGALWFKTTAFGDDKDRVLCRANGETTYFASDIAYHLNKLERGYDTLINVLGADHHGYVPRLRAAIQAMSNRQDVLKTPLVQFVSLYRGQEKVPMSTRSGSFVTLRELREEVGNDAARYFYIMRKLDQALDFDLNLAKSESNENPVYYIQYAHARIASVWRQLHVMGLSWDESHSEALLHRLNTKEEIAICKQLAAYPDVIGKAALSYEPHLLTHYLYDLAQHYHSYYVTSKCLVDDADLRSARLALNMAIQHVLANGLRLLGISAPQKM